MTLSGNFIIKFPKEIKRKNNSNKYFVASTIKEKKNEVFDLVNSEFENALTSFFILFCP